MKLLKLPIAILAFLGRHGTLAIALSLLLGAALPFLAATLRPWLDEAILMLLTLAFLRIGFRALGEEFKAPLPVLWAVALALLVIPFAALAIGRWTGFSASHPELYLALFIALAVPPVTAVPIFAGLLRLPGPIALAFLILAMAATPFAATLHAKLFFEPGTLPFDGLEIGLRLAGFLFGSAVLAAIIQKLAGRVRLEAWRAPLDGLNVLAMFVFAVAVMDGFGPALIATPALVLVLLVATFVLAIGQMALMRAALWFMDGARASAIAMATGLRNMGLMVAALGMAIPDTTWLWFAIGQFPIFMMPWIVERIRAVRGASQHPAQ